MVMVSDDILRRVTATYGLFVSSISKLPAAKCARDVLDESKAHDQVALFCATFGIQPSDLAGKRLLEIGSGFGIFLAVLRRDYAVDAHGVEPGAAGFESSYTISRDVLKHYGMDSGIVRNAMGEDLPFPDSHFDFVFSSTVLEHTEDPALVLDEAIRVLKAGGRLQFVYPNYGAFFEGHYTLPWIPYLGHTLGRLWVRLWGRDPAFVDTLYFTTYFGTRRWLRWRRDITVVTYGEGIFRDRMLALKFKDWGGLGKLRGWLEVAHRLRVIRPLTWLLLHLKSFDPIVLSLVKQPDGDLPPQPDNREIYELHWTDWTDMKLYGPSSRWLRALIGRQLQMLPSLRETGRVLDLGCGEGTATSFLATELPASDVIGIDRSELGVQCAVDRHRRRNLSFVCAEDTSTLQAGSFELVTCFEVLEHVEDWRAMAREIARLSSRYVMVSFPTGRMRSFERYVGHVRNFRRGQFERFTATIGLEPISVFYAGFPFYSPIFREFCNLTNSGGNALTIGKYSWWQKRLSDVIYVSFRYLSLTNRGDQFCGLFEKNPRNRPVPAAR